MSKFALACAVTLALALAVWLALDARRPSSGAEKPTSEPDRELGSVIPDLPAPIAEPKPIATSERAAVATAEAPAEPSVAPAPESIVLFGVVRPIPGRESATSRVFVSATGRDGTRRQVETSVDGSYSIPALAAGHYDIVAGTSSGASARDVADLAPSEREHRLDLQLVDDDAHIEIHATDRNGVAIEHLFGLGAIATDAAPGAWIGFAAGMQGPSGLGRFRSASGDKALRSSEQPPSFVGELAVHSARPYFVSLTWGEWVLETRAVVDEVTRLDFVVDPDTALARARLTLRLVDATTHEPLPNVGFQIDMPCGSAFSNTHEDGRSGFQISCAGSVQLMFNARGYERGMTSIRIEPGEIIDLGDVLLAPERWVAGRIVDSNGAPVQKRLRYWRVDPATNDIVPTHTGFAASPRPDGTFRVGGLSRAVYRFSLEGWDEPAPGAERDFDLALSSIDDVTIVVKAP